MNRPLLIVNPKAGLGLYQRHIPVVVNRLSAAGIVPAVYITQSTGDAKRIAKEKAEEYDAVICYGGDGTLNEVVSGVLESGTGRTIGYIPAGSTNDYAYSLKLPADIRKLSEILLTGKEQESDVGLFNERPFVYVAAFGAFTSIPYTTDQVAKNIFGHAAYIMEGVRTLMDISPVHMTVETDGERIEDDFIFGMISNSESVAGVHELLPGAEVRLNDGYFEMLLIRYPVTLTDWNEILTCLSTKSTDDKHIYYRKVNDVTFRSPSESAWTLDGESGGAFLESRIVNRHAAFKIIVPD